jgi:hypothetical protein
LQLFIKSKTAPEDEIPDPINASALRCEFKAAPVTHGNDNFVRIQAAAKAATRQQRFHSRVYVGTVHANLKFLPNRNWYPGDSNRACPARCSIIARLTRLVLRTTR